MLPADLEMTSRALGSIDSEQVKSALLLSPSLEQVRLFTSRFKGGKVICYNHRMWDLNETHEGRFDLIFLGNVMMYSPSPEVWFRNLFRSARLVLVQDLIERYRSYDEAGFGSDDDRIRYEFLARNVISRQRPAFDLSGLDQACLDFTTYQPDPKSLHFVGLWQVKNALDVVNVKLPFRTRFLSAVYSLWLKTRAWLKALFTYPGSNAPANSK